MDREIKFRAWLDDGYNKWMEYDFYIHSSSGVLYDESTTTYDTPNKEIEQAHNLTIMQCTGLKDISGADIYEGDIVSHAKESNLTDKTTFIGCDVVNWSNSKARFELGPHDLYGMIFKAYKILGNIYENPELLEEIYG